jgi:pimeloyl-ACP methyl ester carboxylesterase
VFFDDLALPHGRNMTSIKAAVGFGVGLGGNVLTRFALKYPSKMYGLILINGITRGPGWLEGLTLKVRIA